MRKIREMLRLHFEQGLSQRAIAQSLTVARSTVGDLLGRFQALGLSWPLPAELDDATLEARLYPGNRDQTRKRPEPDWNEVHRELRRKGVTLQLLWLEYREAHPDGYQYSQFCHRYRTWHGQLDVVMRQQHRAGEKLFVDYAGQTVPIIDPETGEVRQAQIFVAVLGASNYTYAEACWGQDLPAWIGAHCRALEFLGGVPEVVVPDNLKSGVKAVDRYEPDLNPTYLDWAQHYGTVVIPARPRKARDKAKVEKGVQVVSQWILARLRNRTFFRLGELNQAIHELLPVLNGQRFQKLEGSRQLLYETLDRPALRPLPTQRYEFASWKRARVHLDYHVDVEKNYYSVPHTLVRQEVEVRLTGDTVEVLHRGHRVASHRRLTGRDRFTTQRAHMPRAHQEYLNRTPARLIQEAATVGLHTKELVEAILQDRPHPEQGYRACQGILRLARNYPASRLEAAAERALRTGVRSYKRLQSILDHGLDQVPLEPRPELPPMTHANVRGAHYFNTEGV